MLDEYKKAHKKAIIQYLVVDINGIIIESDDAIILNICNQNITDLHPFFESLKPLLKNKNKEHLFSCIHLEINGNSIIADITLKSSINKDNSLLIIQDLTSHYNNYQLTAQIRNESVINSEILELKNKYLKEKEDFKNSFIANFSHEIREPLSGISTFIDILSKTQLSTEQKDYLNIINNSSNQLKHMIEDILDISKIEVGKLNLIEEPFNLLDFINDFIFKNKIKAQQKGLLFHHDLGPKLPHNLIGDPFRLEQILTNLVDNAIKYTPKGTVTLNMSLNQIRANRASIHFEIIDTGIGIEEKNIETVFNSFTQINTGIQNKGAGLGLAIVKSLVKLNGGNISMKSELNQGTCVSFNLSFKVDNTTKKKIKKPDVIEEHSSNKKYNILLVEHSEITQLSVLKILASQGQFYLDICSNSADVIPTIQNKNVDLILMDINLPTTTGDELTKKIRQLPEREHKKIPIIALTGKVFPEDLKRYKKAKINDVIAKPFDENSLIKTIHKYLK